MYIVGLRHRGTRPPEPLASLGEGLGIVLQYVSSEVTCLLTIAVPSQSVRKFLTRTS
jgi:hypothetical protein